MLHLRWLGEARLASASLRLPRLRWATLNFVGFCSTWLACDRLSLLWPRWGGRVVPDEPRALSFPKSDLCGSVCGVGSCSNACLFGGAVGVCGCALVGS